MPGISARRAASSSASVMPMATCPSCPQACMTPGVPEAKGASSISVSGRASMSARQATVRPGLSPRKMPTTPVVPPMPVCTSKPGGVQAFGDDFGGAVLLETQLRVAVEVAPQGHETIVAGRQIFRPSEGGFAQGGFLSIGTW